MAMRRLIVQRKKKEQDTEMKDVQKSTWELPEIIFAVFHFIPREELLTRACLVCKLWYDIANHKQLWWHHTLISNPYYFENKKALTFFNAEAARRQKQTLPEGTTPKTPASPVAPVKASDHKAQLYSYKHYFYDLKQQSSKKPYNDPPVSVLNCQDYFAETRLISKFTSAVKDADSQESIPTPTSPQQEITGFFQRVSSLSFMNTLMGSNKVLFERDEVFEKKIAATLPSKRYRHTLTKVNYGDRQLVYMIGGIRSTAGTQPAELAESDVYVLECVPDFKANIPLGFRPVPCQGKPPHLGKHTTVAYQGPFDTYPKLYIFGGVENEAVTNNLYVYDLATNVWTLIDKGKNWLRPSPRTNHQVAVIGNEMYCIGGGLGAKMVPTNEVWVLNLDTLDWRVVEAKNSEIFTPRLGFVMVHINKKLLIYGGGFWHQTSPFDRYWKEKYTDLFIFDTETLTFTKIETTGQHPQTGTFPAHTMIGAHWFICGGAYENEISNEMYCLDTVTFHWRRIDTKFYGGDSLACVHVTHQQQHRLLIYGGYCYTPLGTAEVYKLNYLEMMNERGLESITDQKRRKVQKTLSCAF